MGRMEGAARAGELAGEGEREKGIVGDDAAAGEEGEEKDAGEAPWVHAWRSIEEGLRGEEGAGLPPALAKGMVLPFLEALAVFLEPVE